MKQKNGVVEFYSYKMNNKQCCYSTMKKEILAVLISLKSFRKVILGCNIMVHIDNKNLLFQKKDYDKRLYRWFVLINEYNVKFRNINGLENIFADFLSRNNVLNINTNENSEKLESANQLPRYELIKCIKKSIIKWSSRNSKYV